MKLSDVQGITREEWTFAHPRSSLADPPITAQEARSAATANCPRHHGLIATQPTQADTEGRVYLCGVGNQYWRYSRKSKVGALKPLNYGWRRTPC